MTREKIENAVREAARFIQLSGVALASKSDREDPCMWASKDNSAVRRASMDLTRALAEMRRPG